MCNSAVCAAGYVVAGRNLQFRPKKPPLPTIFYPPPADSKELKTLENHPGPEKAKPRVSLFFYHFK